MATPSRDIRAVLSHAQFYCLCEWLKETDQTGAHINLAGVHTKTALARKATTALSSPISEFSVGNALETTNLVLESASFASSGGKDRARIVAGELVSLLRELGKEPSPALLAIYHGNRVPD